MNAWALAWFIQCAQKVKMWRRISFPSEFSVEEDYMGGSSDYQLILSFSSSQFGSLLFAADKLCVSISQQPLGGGGGGKYHNVDCSNHI